MKKPQQDKGPQEANDINLRKYFEIGLKECEKIKEIKLEKLVLVCAIILAKLDWSPVYIMIFSFGVLFLSVVSKVALPLIKRSGNTDTTTRDTNEE